MFFNTPKLRDFLYNYIDKSSNYKDKMKLLPVDFDKPWHKIITDQKFLLSAILFIQIITNIFDSLFLILLAKSIEQVNFNLMFTIIAIQFVMVFLSGWMGSLNIIFQIQTMLSVECAANQFFFDH